MTAKKGLIDPKFMNAERCGNCRFYHRQDETKWTLISDEPMHEDDYEAECRRYPPQRTDAEYAGVLSQLEVLGEAYKGPIVKTTGWCGEWRHENS